MTTHPSLPDAIIVDLDAGHSVNIENADGFNSAVAAFMKNVERTG